MDAKRTTRARALALALALASAEVRWIHSVSFPSARVYANARAYAYAYAFDNGIGIGIEVFSRVERICTLQPLENHSLLFPLFTPQYGEKRWDDVSSAALCTGTVQYSTVPVPYSTVHCTIVLYCTVYVGVRVYNALYSTSDANGRAEFFCELLFISLLFGCFWTHYERLRASARSSNHNSSLLCCSPKWSARTRR